jgi:acetylornithine deacetylase/succinyl-diaminopimelate desuccinylase-like protein
MVAFTEQLIAAPSPTPPGDEREVAHSIIGHANQLGLPQPEVLAKVPERPNLLFRIPGDRPTPVLLLNAHMDTKPAGPLALWNNNPWQPLRDGNRIFGLGASDMKAGCAALLYAVHAFLRHAGGSRGGLLLVYTADEEGGSAYGAKFLVESGALSSATAGLIAEPQGIREPFEYIPLVSRGFSGFTFRISGTQMHSSVSDQVPMVNASVQLARLLLRFATTFRPSFQPHPLCPLGPTVNPGVLVSGGVAFGTNPGEAQFSSEVRLIPGMTRQQLELDLQSFLREAAADLPGLQVDLEFAPPPLDWTEPTEVSPQEPLVKALSAASHQILGRQLPLGCFPGGTDAHQFHAVGGVPTIPAFGPGLLTLCHGPNEYVDIPGIVAAAQIYALTCLYYLCK